MHYGALTCEQRQKLGVGDDLLRVAVGLEDPKDIYNDLNQALDSAVE
jgi:cystathionine beta-lyase/cystathionine gamma-synthase